MKETISTGDWAQLKGKISAKWDRFVDKDLESFKDNMDSLSDKIRETYGYTKEKAEQEYRDFKKSVSME